jgi:hypothetical protein
MYMSVAFFSIMTQLVVSFAAPGLLVERLPVYYRQRDAHFMPAWCARRGSPPLLRRLAWRPCS